MKTSDVVIELGLYASQCCSSEELFDHGDTFSRCPKCLRLCDWELVEPVISYQELEPWTEQAA
jgi:hypothetical protein